MKRTKKLKDIILCALFCSLMITGAYIKIPVPPVPVTMQTFFVILLGLCLGAKNGFVSFALYVVLGITGLPVFSGGGGIGYILTPYFGYIIGFGVATIVAGRILCICKSFLKASLAATAAIYICEIIWFVFVAKIYLSAQIEIVDFAVFYLSVPLIKDLIFCPIVSDVAKRIRAHIEKL